MFWHRSCPTCAASVAEVVRLTVQLNAANERNEKLTAEVLELARDATGHSRRAPPMDPPLPALPEITDTFLAFRFGHGSPLWRQQVREARRLLASGMEPLDVNEKLARGKNMDDIV